MISSQHSVYKSSISNSNHGIAEWSFSANENCITKVVPDGCCDIIVVEESVSKPSRWFISELSSSVYDVHSNAGERMRGVRLKPGTQIDKLALNQWVESHHIDELFADDQLGEFCQLPVSISEALLCLADKETISVDAGARMLGVSVRTLQRVIKSGTLQTPYFWHSLARMRRAAKSLLKFNNLADVAIACHFSDQAHMTRDLNLWLGLPPGKIKSDSELMSLLNEPGYA